MKKSIAILGSTGSIGKITLNIIKKEKKKFNIIFLTANKNIKLLIKQGKEFNVKYLVINDKKVFANLKNNNRKLKIFNNVKNLKKLLKKKIDYSMCSISGLAGLEQTLETIELSKSVAIANKESIICGWNLIERKLNKSKTKFIPIDSEHFSIWSLLKNYESKQIEQVIITASGGPFLNLPLNKFKNINQKSALKHPNWNMGKKISIDSATLANKLFEVVEAQRIFKIHFNKFKILIHPKSYVHAIIKFNNGLTKILIHDTNMTIPIFNSIYTNVNRGIKSKIIDINILNNLNFKEVDLKRFPIIKLLKKIPQKCSLYETVLISANDELVNLFLKNKIQFRNIYFLLKKFLNLKEFNKYKLIHPNNLAQIMNLDEYVRLKIKSLCIE